MGFTLKNIGLHESVIKNPGLSEGFSRPPPNEADPSLWGGSFILDPSRTRISSKKLRLFKTRDIVFFFQYFSLASLAKHFYHTKILAPSSLGVWKGSDSAVVRLVRPVSALNIAAPVIAEPLDFK